jgi:LPS-assembly protein
VRGPVVHRRLATHATRITRATALACLLAAGITPPAAIAQDISGVAASVPEGSQMLLESDTLIYDNDASTVTAAGGVRIDYGGNRLVAQRVTYDRKTSRLIASGDVQLIDSDGTKVFADTVDITDDFGNGFVNALRVETIDKTYFAAESAERQNGVLTTFNNGVYTACKPCEEKPDRAPIWRIKARKIIWDGKSKVVRFERSRFEFFGLPIAGLPYFEMADPTVKRKSGFLLPGISVNDDRGVGISLPYYLALSPTYDLTLRPTYYTKQGFLGEAEWRQKFNNGEYSLKIAGMRQNDPDAFIDSGSRNVNSGTAVDPNRFRGMVGTKGRFDLNDRWKFGWDILAQTDKNFAYTYGINGYQNYYRQNEIYLTGLNDRNYFDVRAIKFSVQENLLDTNAAATNDKQPWVLPTLDYSYTPDEPVFGGELNLDMNLRSIHRSKLDNQAYITDGFNSQRGTVRGIEGSSTRLTGEAEWKRSFITDGGLVVTPLLAFQADAIGVNASQSSVDAINQLARDGNVGADQQSLFTRMMATAGMELRWPLLFAMAGGGSHVIEPMAQVFARPNEAYGTTLGIPNEDAQSFVFDASTLFERDKFSGYDRTEGGSRANVGVRYTGIFGAGWGTNALFGQSYQLAGLNSFASPDLVYAGAESGLETAKSDYVGLVGFTSPYGVSASASGRFDEQTFELRRAEAKMGYTSSPLTVTSTYTFIQAQPLYGFTKDRHEVTLASSLRFHENWRTFGSATYDFESAVIASDSIGFAYDDECFSYTMTMATTRDLNKKESDSRTFGFNISFRTLGDFGSSSSALAQ